MARQITIYVPPNDHAWLTTALQALADEVISDAEAGQRGAKVSRLVHLIASAYIKNAGETARLVREIKRQTTA